MFEIVVFCVILFAIAYWTTLFIMGRRDDVLHGEFVEAEPELAAGAAGAAMPASAPTSIFPPKPVIAPRAEPAAVTAPEPPPVVASRPEKPADTEALLQSLLASLKRELKNAAQI